MAINALEVVSLELARLQCAVDEGDFVCYITPLWIINQIDNNKLD